VPKPLQLRRPSGLYVRFLVLVDLRPALGRRFFVRSLGSRRGDEALLVATTYAVALFRVFDAVRKEGGMADIKKLWRVLSTLRRTEAPTIGRPRASRSAGSISAMSRSMGRRTPKTSSERLRRCWKDQPIRLPMQFRPPRRL